MEVGWRHRKFPQTRHLEDVKVIRVMRTSKRPLQAGDSQLNRSNFWDASTEPPDSGYTWDESWGQRYGSLNLQDAAGMNVHAALLSPLRDPDSLQCLSTFFTAAAMSSMSSALPRKMF